jgi:NADPH:quinone reductase
MQAVAVIAPGQLGLVEVPDPAVSPGQVLVAVKAFSLNRGETKTALDAASGHRPGWDFSGVVEAGEGVAPGTRVVGMLAAGAWAEKIVASPMMLAPIPDAVSFQQASTLPVAGLTAVHSLRKRGELAGRKVLITGASGGVGVFAIQLAAAAGAEVTAAIRNPANEALVRRLGAKNAAVGDIEAARAFGPYDLILESVGGQTLGGALGMLNPQGVCVLFGASDNPVTTFNAQQFRVGSTTLYGLYLGEELTRDPPGPALGDLAARIAAGTLDPMVEVEAPWAEIGRVADDLIARRFSGKAVLTVG